MSNKNDIGVHSEAADEVLSEIAGEGQGLDIAAMFDGIARLDADQRKELLGDDKAKDFMKILEQTKPCSAGKPAPPAPLPPRPAPKEPRRDSKPTQALNKLAGGAATLNEANSPLVELARATDVDMLSVTSEANSKRLSELTDTMETMSKSIERFQTELSLLVSRLTVVAHEVSVLKAKSQVVEQEERVSSAVSSADMLPGENPDGEWSTSLPNHFVVPPAHRDLLKGEVTPVVYKKKNLG